MTLDSDARTALERLTVTEQDIINSFVIREIPASDIVSHARRAHMMKEWLDTYDILVGDYEGSAAVAVTVGGNTFVDRAEDFPSELLFANVTLAIESGNVAKAPASKRQRFRW
jgi:hypothetical protein